MYETPNPYNQQKQVNAKRLAYVALTGSRAKVRACSLSQDAGHAAIVENFCCNLDPIAGWPAMHASRNIAPYGDRTRDHTLTERMLYQLS